MPKKNRKRASVKTNEHTSIQKSAAGSTPPSTAESSQATSQPNVGKWSTNRVAWLALIVSVLSGLGTIGNALTSRRNYDRLAGRISARIELAGVLPTQENIPPQLIQISTIFDAPELTLSEVDDLFRLAPAVVLKNIGDEPIGEIRVEVRSGFNFIDARGESEERQRMATPWALEDATRDDYLLSEKLLPGKKVCVPIIKGLLKQMVQLQAEDRPDCWHYSQFEVRCMAKLVNAASFDGIEDGSCYSVKFRWQPTGFPKSKCVEVLEGLKHVPIVE